MDRRRFLGIILVGGAAPAIVRASSLMKVTGIIVPTNSNLLMNTAFREYSWQNYGHSIIIKRFPFVVSDVRIFDRQFSFEELLKVTR